MSRPLAIAGLLVVVVVVAVAIVLFASALAGDGREPDCGTYSFGREDWDAWGDSREFEAEALAACGTLAGMTPNEVSAMLGQPSPRGAANAASKWIYLVGEVNDELGPGDAQILSIFFGPDNGVERLTLQP